MLQTKSSPNNLSHLNRDRGYRFRDRDPVLDEICPLIEKSGLETKQISKKIAEMSHSTAVVSFSTIDKWLNGKTIRPQNFTVTWVMAAIGYERKWKKIR